MVWITCRDRIRSPLTSTEREHHCWRPSSLARGPPLTGAVGTSGFKVKRYKSEKAVTEEGFLQTRGRLESLNPAYPSWDLDQDKEKYQIVAEFVRVLE